MSKEERNEGDVPWATYWRFVLDGGKWAFFGILSSQLACQALLVYANFWLTDWGRETNKYQRDLQEEMPLRRSLHWYRGYAGMLAASIFCVTVRLVRARL